MRKTINYQVAFDEGCSFHVYNRSINSETIFKTDKQFNFFLKKCKILLLPFFDIEAYCIMPNHFHFLIRVKLLSNEVLEMVKKQGTSKSVKYLRSEISYDEFLIDQFKRLFQSYAVSYNLEEKRNGSVFQKRFKRILIKDENRWQHILTYIHHNPIHHKFKTEYFNWKYSSYNSFLSNSPTSVARQQVLIRFDKDLGKAKKEFLKIHEIFKTDKKMNHFYLD